jgi:hypothetical protein
MKILLVCLLCLSFAGARGQMYLHSKMGGSDFVIEKKPDGRYMMYQLSEKTFSDTTLLSPPSGELLVTEVEKTPQTFWKVGHTKIKAWWVVGIQTYYVTLYYYGKLHPEQSFALYYGKNFYAGVML